MVNPQIRKDHGSQEPPLVIPTCPGAEHGSSDTLVNILVGMLQQQQQQMTLFQQQMTLLQQQMTSLQQQLPAQQQIIIELQQQQKSKLSNYFLELKEAHAHSFDGSTDPLKAEKDRKRPRPCNEQYEETESAANKQAKAIQRNLAGSTVHGQDDKLNQVVRFRSLEKPKEDEFCLELSKQNSYDEVVESVARHLSLDDSSKIRLTARNYFTRKPNPQPIYRGVELLKDMLIHSNKTSDILYYEVLDIPLPELQGLKSLKVAFYYATKDEVVSHTIRLAKQSTVGDVMNHLKTKAELSHPNAELRLLEVFYHKIYKIFSVDEKIEKINNQYWTLRAEEIPEEEKTLGPHDRLIHVYHFMKDSSQNQVWKFAFVSLGHPLYLQDLDIVISCFKRRVVYGAWEQYLGLEHSDNTPKSDVKKKENEMNSKLRV